MVSAGKRENTKVEEKFGNKTQIISLLCWTAVSIIHCVRPSVGRSVCTSHFAKIRHFTGNCMKCLSTSKLWILKSNFIKYKKSIDTFTIFFYTFWPPVCLFVYIFVCLCFGFYFSLCVGLPVCRLALCIYVSLSLCQFVFLLLFYGQFVPVLK